MKTKYLMAALLALAGGGLTATAQTVTSGLNDLVLGFYATGGTGATTDLEVDLGNVSQFYGVGGTLTLSSLNTDLSSTYGSSWNTRTDLFWGVVGTTGSANGTTINSNTIAAKTIWGGSLNLGSGSTPWNKSSTFTQQTTANAVATLYSGASGSLNGATALSDNTAGALISNALAGSWTKQEGSSNTLAFGSTFNPRSSFDITTNIAAGSFAAADLYEVQPGTGAGTELGTFALSSGGNLTYGASLGAATVPEPSTYAAILGATMLGFVSLYRRSQRMKG